MIQILKLIGLSSLAKKGSPLLKWGGILLVILFFGKTIFNAIKGVFAPVMAKINLGSAVGSASAAASNDVSKSNVSKYGEPYDSNKCEGIVATVKEAFGWNDDEDSIIEALNSCSNGTEVKYCSELYKLKYSQSLKAKVIATLNRSEKDKLSTIVQINWY